MQHDKFESSADKEDNVISDEQILKEMDKRVNEELHKFIKSPPKKLTKEQEDRIKRMNGIE